jgi:DNA-binding transcriptional regulator YiaG
MATIDLDSTELLEVSTARRLVRTGEAQTIRERAGVSQLEVARVLGVSDAAVSRWEAHERTPRADVAVRYAQLLRALKAHR